MVVVHRTRGYRFVIYTQDHESAHVHVTGPGQAKIDLQGETGPELIYSIGIGRADMRRLMQDAAEHRDRFLREWERIHGARD